MSPGGPGGPGGPRTDPGFPFEEIRNIKYMAHTFVEGFCAIHTYICMCVCMCVCVCL